MNEFVTWTVLATFAGAVAMTTVLTQLFKGSKLFPKLNPQLVSFIFAFVILILAKFFTEGLTTSEIILTVFNAVIISLTANGGFDAVKAVVGKDKIPEVQGYLDTNKNLDNDYYKLTLNEELKDLADRNTVTLQVRDIKDSQE